MTVVELWDGGIPAGDVLLLRQEHEQTFWQYLADGLVEKAPQRIYRVVPNAYGFELLVGTYAASHHLGVSLRDVSAAGLNQCPHEVFLDAWEIVIASVRRADLQAYWAARRLLTEWYPEVLKGATWLLEVLDSYCRRIVEPMLYGSPHAGLPSVHWGRRWWRDRPGLVKEIESLLTEMEQKAGEEVLGPLIEKLKGIRRQLMHFGGTHDGTRRRPTLSPLTTRLRVASAYCAAVAEAMLRTRSSAMAIQLSHRSADLYLLALAIEANLYDPNLDGGSYRVGKPQQDGSLLRSLGHLRDGGHLATNEKRDTCFEALNRTRNFLFCTHAMYGLELNGAQTLCTDSRRFTADLDEFGSTWTQIVRAFDPAVELVETAIFRADEGFSTYVVDITGDYRSPDPA